MVNEGFERHEGGTQFVGAILKALLAAQVLFDLQTFRKSYIVQRRSQKADRATHIEGRLLDQAMILFNCIPFQKGTSLKGKNLLTEGAKSFLYEQFLIECFFVCLI